MSVPEQALGATPPSVEGSPSQEGVVSSDTSSRDMFGADAVWTIPGSDKRVYIKTPTEIVISGGKQKRVEQLFATNNDVQKFLEDNGYIFDHFRGQEVVAPDVVGSTDDDRPALAEAGEIPAGNEKTARGTARKAKRASGGVERGGEGTPLKPEIETVEQSTEETGNVAQNNGNLGELLKAREMALPTASSTPVESAPVLPEKKRRPKKTRGGDPRETPPTTVKDTSSWRKELDSFLEQPGAQEIVQKIKGILLERWNAFSSELSQVALEKEAVVSDSRKHFLWNRFVIAKLEEVLVQYLMSTSQIDKQEAQKIFRAIDRGLQESGRAKK